MACLGPSIRTSLQPTGGRWNFAELGSKTQELSPEVDLEVTLASGESRIPFTTACVSPCQGHPAGRVSTALAFSFVSVCVVLVLLAPASAFVLIRKRRTARNPRPFVRFLGPGCLWRHSSPNSCLGSEGRRTIFKRLFVLYLRLLPCNYALNGVVRETLLALVFPPLPCPMPRLYVASSSCTMRKCTFAGTR